MPVEDILFRVSVSAPEVEFGEAFPLTVVRVWESGATPAVWSDDLLAPLVVRDETTTVREGDGRVEETRRFRAHAFTLDDVRVAPPRFEAAIGGASVRSVDVEPIVIRVRPSLDRARPGPAELPGDPIPEPVPTTLVAGASLVAIAAAVAVARARRRTAETGVGDDVPESPPTAPTDPGARTLDRLAALRTRDVRTPDDVQAFHVGVTAAVREYVRDRFAVHAVEMTQEEILSSLDAVPAAQRRSLSEAFDGCDFVKFALAPSTPAERDRVVGAAERFVRETSPPPRPDVAAGSDPA